MFIQKPENVLKKAEDLIKVGNKPQALSQLYDVLAQRRYRTWQQTHEKVMERFLELCVDARNNRMAKEGLIQYRNLSQHQAPNSLETVIEFMLSLAEKKAKQASKDFDQRALEDVEDLEYDKSPENILLASVASEQDKDRTERKVLIPWLKFLWESYRSVLEILRNNTRLQPLYHATARRTFEFCVEYSRNTEFRKLCEILRTHATKSRETEFPADVVELQLGTRFDQLKVASKLRLWNEGFRTIEDIHYILSRTDKRPSSQLEATYFQKLTDLFLISESYLFHAYAYKAYYLISIEKNKSLTAEQGKVLASCVLLSAMSIPLQTSKAGTTYRHKDSQKQKNRKMAQLLGFDINPKRKSILQDLLDQQILEMVLPHVKELYFVLECSFQPLGLVSRVIPLLESLKSDDKLKNYVAPLENLLIVRTVSQLSQVYYSVKLDYLRDVLAGLDRPFIQIEKVIVKAVKSRQIEVHSFRIDHVAGCIHFAEDVMEEQRTRRLLTDMARGLHSICVQLEPAGKAKLHAENRALRAKIVLQHIEHTHTSVLRRKEVIEKRKETYQLFETQRKAQEQEQALEKERLRKEEEERTIALQRKQRADAEMEKLKAQEKEFQIRQILIEEGVDLQEKNVKNMTLEEQQKLIEETRRKAESARRETDRKVEQASKRLDALVRAIREKEKEKWKKLYEVECKQSEIDHGINWKKRLESAHEEHQKALISKKEVECMQNSRQQFEEVLVKRWRNEYRKDRDHRYRILAMRMKNDKLDRARKRRQQQEKEKIRRKEEEERVERERRRKHEEEERQARRAEEEERARNTAAAQVEQRPKKYQPPQARSGMDDFGDRGGGGGRFNDGRRSHNDSPSQDDNRGEWRGGNDNRRGFGDDRKSGAAAFGGNRRRGGGGGDSRRGFDDRGGDSRRGFDDRGGDSRRGFDDRGSSRRGGRGGSRGGFGDSKGGGSEGRWR